MENIFLVTAYAEPAAAGATDGAGGLMSGGLFMYVILFAMLYFMMIRPQRQKDKKLKQMRNNLKIGDEVVTVAGIYGKVLQLKDDTIVIELNAEKTKMRIAKWAIQEVKELISD